jgi:hypothetical protein
MIQQSNFRLAIASCPALFEVAWTNSNDPKRERMSTICV